MTTARATSLNAARRERELAALSGGEAVDVLVIGGGVTGTGVALDAASRGLSVALVERHDLAHGTSRWSSKLVHGGVRYLMRGEVGLAYESARERGHLMERIAPHLVRPLPMMMPEGPGMTARQAATLRTGLWAVDALRLAAGTRRVTLPRPRHLSRAETLRVAPGLTARELRGAVLSWDGQLIDDARLVVTIARTAAGYGARILTRCAAVEPSGEGARVRDELTGQHHDLRARAVINATGVWAQQFSPELRLRPSRGTHLVVPLSRLGGTGVAFTVLVPGEPGRYVMALPQPDGRAYIGLTDEAVTGDPDVLTQPQEHEIDFLLRTINTALAAPLERADVLGAFSGLRPLLDDPENASERTADLSRRHAVLAAPDGTVTVVGGKLTTYRKMAKDAVDAAITKGRLPAGPCRTARLPLVGAAPVDVLDRVDAPRRLVRRYGTEAPAVLATGGNDRALTRPLARGTEVTGAELLYGLRHEGAFDLDDLLDRRTRLGLVPAEREHAARAAVELLPELRVGDRVG